MKHALFGGSSASRWLHCPLSSLIWSRVEKELGKVIDTEEDISAAEFGTAVHTLAFDAFTGIEQNIFKPYAERVAEYLQERSTVMIDTDGGSKEYDVTDEVREHAAFYLGEIEKRSYAGNYQLEVTVSCGSIAPDFLKENVFGTADFAAVNVEAGWITIADLKTGRVVVSAKNNEQMLTYASGVYLNLSKESQDKIDTITLVVIDSRRRNVDEWVLDVKTLKQFIGKMEKTLNSLEPTLDAMVDKSEALTNLPAMIEAGLVIEGLQQLMNSAEVALCKTPTTKICGYCPLKDFVVCPKLAKSKNVAVKEMIEAGTKKNIDLAKEDTAFEQLQKEYIQLDNIKMWVASVEKAFKNRLSNMAEEDQGKSLYEIRQGESKSYSLKGGILELFSRMYNHEYDENNTEDMEIMDSLYAPTKVKSLSELTEMAKSLKLENGIKDLFEKKPTDTKVIVKKTIDTTL